MPQVPVAQGNRERLAPIPNEKFDAADMSSVSRAFGQGLVGLGQAGAQAADAVDQIQDVYDEHDARQLDVEHAARAREIRRRVRQTHGIAAQPAALQADTELQELDREILARARSRNARTMLEPLVQRRSSVERDGNTEYSDQQTTVAVDAGYSARIDTTLGEAEEQWQHPEVQEERLQTALGEITRRGEWRGADPATIAGERAQATSRIRSSVVEQLVQQENYDGAAAYLEAHHGEIGHEQETSLRRMVYSGLRDLDDDRAAAWGASDRPASEAPAPVVGALPAPANDDAPARGSRATPPTPSSGPNGHARTPFSAVRSRIIANEAGPSVGGYNALAYNTGPNTNAAGVRAPRPITQMTMGEVYDFQRGSMRAATRGRRGQGDVGSTGVGAYQFESETLRQNAEATFGSNWRSQPFSAANQDRVAETLWNTVRGNPALLRNTWAAFSGSGSGAAPAPTSPAPDGRSIDLERAYARIETLDISPTAKLRARNRVRELAAQNEIVRDHAEQEAGRQADLWLADNGDTYTNPAQIPGYTSLSPARQANLADRARQNREGAGRAVTPELLQLYNYTRFANPQRFASPEFQRELITRGAPQTMLRQWGAESGQLMGQSASQVAQRVGDERLWQIAKPVLREAGMDFDRVDVDPAARGTARRELSAADRAADTHRKNLMLTRLREFSQIWAQAHPGQVPDDAVMRGWVGNLLLGVNGQRSFEADDQTIFIQLAGTPMGREIAANLGRRNVAPTPQNVVAAYRRLLALQSAPRQ